jgi:protein phosphatase
MGTTLTAAYLLWPMLYVLHVGDSRCYVLRGGSLELLTKDQTLAQHLCDCGQLKGTEFEESPYHHVLLSSIGAQETPDAVVYKTRLLTGDRILLCSDGVNAHVEDSEIEQILGSDQSPDEVCRQLIDLANARGGRDNITAFVAFSEV